MQRSLPSLRLLALGATGLLAAAAVAQVSLGAVQPGGRAEDLGRPLGIALSLLATVPLTFIARRPRLAMSMMAPALFATTALGYGSDLGGLALFVGVGVAATRLRIRRAAPLVLVAGAVVVIAPQLASDKPPVGNAISNVSVVVLSAVLGVGARLYRRHAAELEERTRQLEELRDAETREAVAQERLRIARDVHDVVGHALAAITLHARVAGRRLQRDPASAARSLEDIAGLASGALAETREAVGQLRTTADAADLRPQPRLADIDELVARLRASDLAIELTRRGDAPSTIPPLVQAAAYRIVQESLSNVARHARPAQATVLVEQRPSALHVEIRDDGDGSLTEALSGHGLVGMRERAAGVGGALDAGPAPGGGWQVSATLPIGSAG